MAKREIKRPVTEEDIHRWEEGWAQMMITIWREKILALGIVDTMSLYNRMSHVVSIAEGVTAVTHEFLAYGIFMEAGTGRGYEIHGKKYYDKKGNFTHTGYNPGDLDILDPYYRKAHGLDKPRKRGPKSSTKDMTTGKPREPRRWFSRKYLSSRDVLNKVMRDLYGNAYMGTFSNVVRLMFNTREFVEGVKEGKLSAAEMSMINL